MPARQEHAAGAAFVSDALGYSFTLPTPGWRRRAEEDELEQVADMLIEHSELGTLKLVAFQWHLDFEDLSAGLENSFRAEMKDFRALGAGRTAVAGFPAAYLEYEGVPAGGSRVRAISYVFVRGEFGLKITASAAPKRFPRLKEEVAAAVASFSFDPYLASSRRGESGLPAAPGHSAASETVPPPALPDRVIANWQRRGFWFLGEVVQRQGRRALVHFIDGDEEWCDPDQVRPPQWIPGLRVLARPGDTEYWYPGFIREIGPEGITVGFFDGTDETLPPTDLRLEDIGPGDSVITHDMLGNPVNLVVRERRQDGCLCDLNRSAQVVVAIPDLALARKASRQE